jgi:hypothetical protein
MWNPFKRSSGPTTVKDEWAIGQGENEGRPMLVRINTGLKPIVGRQPFIHRTGVTFLLRAPDENGFPAPDESGLLNEFEDALLQALSVSAQAHLALVITTSGFREFVLYTANLEATSGALDGLRTRFATHEIQSYVELDEAWEVYRTFAG